MSFVLPSLAATAIAVFASSIAPAHANTELSHAPGIAEDEGTYFELADSSFYDLRAHSTEPVRLLLEAINTRQIVITVVGTGASGETTELLIGGLLPDTLYYVYEDTLEYATTYTTDSTGAFVHLQDLSTTHVLRVQPRHSTYFLRAGHGGDCTKIGDWDPTTTTCTLTTDVFETIDVGPAVSLDGNGYTLDGTPMSLAIGVNLSSGAGGGVRNLTIVGVSVGVDLLETTGRIVADNSIEADAVGVRGQLSANNTVERNEIRGAATAGVLVYWQSPGWTVADNTIYGSGAGFYSWGLNDFTKVERNDIADVTWQGVAIKGRFNLADSNTIVRAGYGVLLQGEYSTIANNLIDEIAYRGVTIDRWMINCAKNTVRGNTVRNCGQYGLWIAGRRGSRDPGCYLSQIDDNHFENEVNAHLEYEARTHNWQWVGLIGQPNIRGGLFRGGNYWATPDGTGFSQTCTDAESDGICDTSYTLGLGNLDRTPLSAKTCTPQTPVGRSVCSATTPYARATFAEVRTKGIAVGATSAVNPGAAMPGYKFHGDFHGLETSAEYAGPVVVCLIYDSRGLTRERETELQLVQLDAGEWRNITTIRDIDHDTVCGETESLSWFATAYEFDTIAPSTAHELEGIEGANGWHTSDVLVTLEACDDEAGSGIARSEYSVGCTAWSEYEGPFEVVAEGETRVCYRSIDLAGNVEPTREVALSIDKTPPMLGACTPQPQSVCHVGHAMALAADDAVSGLLSLRGKLQCADGEVMYVDDGFVPEPGVYSLVVQAVDHAGLVTEGEAVEFVVYDPASGLVTGGGRIDTYRGDSPQDACSFGFNARYKDDQPRGHAKINCHRDGVVVELESVDWLVIGDGGAHFQGPGTLNGQGTYTVRVSASDGGSTGVAADVLGFEVWEGTDTQAAPVYSAGSELLSGNIALHAN